MMDYGYRPVPDDLRLVPTRLHFFGGETYFDFMNQNIRIPSKYCFGEGGACAESFITFRYFKTKRFLRFVVRMARETGGGFEDAYRRYHKLKVLLTRRLQKRVGRYGYYALAEDVDRVERTVGEMNAVITELIERMELPLRFYKERAIREFFLKLRRNCLSVGADWWTPLGIDKEDLESMYEVFRNDVTDDAMERIGPERKWVSGGGWPMEDELFEFRGSPRFREQVARVFADYLEYENLSVDELLDMDRYEDWRRKDLVGDIDQFAIDIADKWWCDGRDA